MDEMADLKKKLELVIEENGALQRELSELRKLYTQNERTHQADVLAIKQDLERLKKTQPDLNGTATTTGGGGGGGGAGSGSPDIYARMKTMKKRPQSLHEMSFLPPNLQEQLQEKSSTHENGTTHLIHGPATPFYFTLDNFDFYRKNSLKWFSSPFYSQCFGYKLCVGVDAGGHSVGEGTHVSILVYILPGEYDDSLKWPFRGSVKISILNERRDGGHFESAIEFNEDTPLINSARVTDSDRSTGWGNAMFIAHSKLAYDAGLDCELLKYNRLRFVVREIVSP